MILCNKGYITTVTYQVIFNKGSDYLPPKAKFTREEIIAAAGVFRIPARAGELDVRRIVDLRVLRDEAELHGRAVGRDRLDGRSGRALGLRGPVRAEVDGQLSDVGTYDEFLEWYGEAIEQHFRILKPNGFAIAVVNDFRKNDTFYNFHGDTIELCKKAGFIQHDIIINTLNGQAMQAIGSFEKLGLKIMPKCHEYVLVFRKPDENGDVKAYREKWKVK